MSEHIQPSADPHRTRRGGVPERTPGYRTKRAASTSGSS